MNNFFYVGHDKDKGFFIDPCNAYSVGIFFEPEGSVNLSDFKLVEGICLSGGPSKICDLREGHLYDILYGDPIMIEGATYLGLGQIGLPPARFRGPYLLNQFFIFEKDYLKIYVNRNMGVEIRPHPEPKKEREKGLRFKEGEILVGDGVGVYVGYETVYGTVIGLSAHGITRDNEIEFITIRDDQGIVRSIPNGQFFKLPGIFYCPFCAPKYIPKKSGWRYLPNDPDGRFYYGDMVELPGGDIGICEGVVFKPLPLDSNPNNLWVEVVVRYCSDGETVEHTDCIVKVIKKNCPKFCCYLTSQKADPHIWTKLDCARFKARLSQCREGKFIHTKEGNHYEEKLITYKGHMILVFQNCNYSVVVGVVTSYKGSKTEFGIPITEIITIPDQDQEPIETLVVESGFTSNMSFWDNVDRFIGGHYIPPGSPIYNGK